MKEIWLYLQMFADDGGDDSGADDGGGQDNDQDDGQGGDDKEPEKVSMTQKELDDLIKKRMDRGKKSWEKDFKQSDDFKAFNDYQENKKTDDQKTQDKLNGMGELETEVERLKKENQSFQNEKLMSKAEVNPEFNDYAMFEINKLVNDDMDFADALDSFVKNEANAKYLKGSDTSYSSGKRQSGGAGKNSSRTNKMLSQLGYGGKS